MLRLKINKLLLNLIVIFSLVWFVAGPVFASSIQEADKYLNKICNKKRIEDQNAVFCNFRDRIAALESKQDTGKHVLDLQHVRGSFWENTDSVNNVPTPDKVIVNCTKACTLWVNYDVDTRNTSAPFQHLYFIYVDGVDQAVFNQATMTTPNAAVPLAVNGVFPGTIGQHTVSIHARTYGGTQQSHESHLQVMAIEQ